MDKATYAPGPWRWEVNMKHKTVNLVGGHTRYDLTVLDFERWGMQNAQPRFRSAADDLDVMQPVASYTQPVPG